MKWQQTWDGNNGTVGKLCRSRERTKTYRKDFRRMEKWREVDEDITGHKKEDRIIIIQVIKISTLLKSAKQ